MFTNDSVTKCIWKCISTNLKLPSGSFAASLEEAAPLTLGQQGLPTLKTIIPNTLPVDLLEIHIKRFSKYEYFHYFAFIMISMNVHTNRHCLLASH